ncbi:hypothetical protein ACN08Z_07720 [Rothia sp. P7181]|uniref:hypothetical protein n=1 Tax=Rothia sp. P7181 TaxID=3402663 RepID=UPI003AD8896D
MLTTPSHTQRTDVSQRTLIPVSLRIILGLVYTASILIAVENLLVTQLNSFGGSQVLSPSATMVFLRVITAGWALLLTLFQGVALSILFTVSTGLPRSRIGESWAYILVAQMPFSLAVFTLFVLGKTDTLPMAYGPYVQQLSGVITAIVFAIFASRGKQVVYPRLVAFIVLTIAANSAILLLTSQIHA